MATTFLVDGHNALFRLWKDPPVDADAARRSVVTRAHAAARARGDAAVHLVFDTTDQGRARAGTHGRDGVVTWSYARGSADEEIVRLVREHAGQFEGRRLVVVTDDRELRGRASQLGAAVLRIHDWFDAPPSAPSAAPRAAPRTGPPFSPADFGMTDAPIDLGRTRPEDL